MASQTPEQVSGSLQVFFEEPFYVGLFEKREAGRLRERKIINGGSGKPGGKRHRQG